MRFRRWEGKMRMTMGLVGAALFLILSCLPCAYAHGQPQTSLEPSGVLRDTVSKLSGTFCLAEVVQSQDSVIMRTDPKDRNYEERQWEEREKERQSWDMLKNMIIDGRQPPRRFSDPRSNERPH
jgi:hypothetical protein